MFERLSAGLQLCLLPAILLIVSPPALSAQPAPASSANPNFVAQATSDLNKLEKELSGLQERSSERFRELKRQFLSIDRLADDCIADADERIEKLNDELEIYNWSSDEDDSTPSETRESADDSGIPGDSLLISDLRPWPASSHITPGQLFQPIQERIISDRAACPRMLPNIFQFRTNLVT